MKAIKKVDEHGMYIPKLAEWKKKNPGKIFFDSMLEFHCFVKMKKRGWDFEFHPPAIELIPSFKCLGFHKGKIEYAKVQDAVYTFDFLIRSKLGNVFLEIKGYFRDQDRIRYKMVQHILSKQENTTTVIIKNDKEFDKFLSIFDAYFNNVKNKTVTI